MGIKDQRFEINKTNPIRKMGITEANIDRLLFKVFESKHLARKRDPQKSL